MIKITFSFYFFFPFFSLTLSIGHRARQMRKAYLEMTGDTNSRPLRETLHVIKPKESNQVQLRKDSAND